MLRALVMILALMASAPAAWAEQRIALVMGNAAYRQTGWALAKPVNDANLMATRLRGLGYSVDLVTNADRGAMSAAFVRFGASIKRAGPDAVAVFYYAGHGAQTDGINYLIPVDAQARTMDEVRFGAIALQLLLTDMASAGNAVNLVILDACRNIPLEEGFRALGSGGLADEGKKNNVFIAYAASPGRVAYDGSGSNSPFTSALAAAIASDPRQPIALLFEQVNARVFQTSSGAQSPEYRNGLVRAPGWSLGAGMASFTRPAPTPAVPVPDPLAAYGADVVAAARRGDWAGVVRAGYDFENGLNGRRQDHAAATALYRNACDSGYSHGCVNLGVHYQNGLGTQQDYARAIQLFRQACDARNAGGCRALGFMYERGNGTAQDYGRAVGLYRQACDDGDSQGCNNLGSLTYMGYGVAVDRNEAMRLWRKALAIDPNYAAARDNLQRFGPAQ